MIRLFKAEAYQDFIDKPNCPTFEGNGDMILQPSECTDEAALNSTWQITMTHPYDAEGRYTYIEKNDVIVVDCKMAREQTTSRQAFRVKEVNPTDDNIKVIAIPVAWESIYETPVSFLNLKEATADEMIDVIKASFVNNRKYTIDLQYHSNKAYSIVVENSNLQEWLNGEQDASFRSLFSTELVYDNYTYHILPELEMGTPSLDAHKYKLINGLNISSIDITESTADMVTRIYPISYEGYEIRVNNHIDSTQRIEQNPFPYARCIKYDDIKFIDIREEDKGNAEDSEPWTSTQIATREAKAKIVAKVRELSEKFLKKARNGEWDYNGSYANSDAKSDNPHEPDTPYNIGADRSHLPYGYIFYSYNDAMGVLAERVIQADLGDIISDSGIEDEELIGENSSVNSGSGFSEENISENEDEPSYLMITDTNEKQLIQEAIKEGFKWCETTEIGAWDWNYEAIYTDPTYNFLKTYRWIQDEHGWYYGDGEGHWLANAWVEDNRSTHYWVGSDGYWDETYDDHEAWQWWSQGEKWWYGNKNADGTPKNWAKEQYIKDTEDGNWYWFNGDGHFVDGNDKKWSYGTTDGADKVMFRYHKIGSHIWWFNSGGYIDDELAYIDNYEWRTDETGDYYGDGKGHWVKNCWVEDSSTSHRWVDADGYEDTSKKDTEEWTWHGSWENGWWYGSDEDDEEEENSSSSPSSSSSSTTNTTKNVLSNIKDILDDEASTMTKDELRTAIADELTGVSYSSASTLGQIDAIVTNTEYTKTQIINKCNTIINSTGYNFDDDDDESDGDTSPDGKTNVSTDTAINYVKNQFMYVTENKTWYWFDENGYMTAAWLSDADWEWHQDSVGWYYGDSKGSYPQGQWMKISGKWYFFNLAGYADDTTDDFEDSKTGDDNSATYDSNREGIGSSSNKDSVDDVCYDRTREGVRAWIQDEFVQEVYAVVMEQHEYLYSVMEDQLKERAEYDLSYMDKPATTITIDMTSLANQRLYERFAFLKDLYLGDHVYFQHELVNYYGIMRVIGIKKDCITGDITEVTFSSSYIGKIKNKLIPGLAKTFSSQGKLITYKPQDALEDGYGGYLKTGYGVDLNTL